MVELVAVEEDQAAGIGGDRDLPGLTGRIVFVQLADQPAHGSLHQTDQDGIARAAIIRRVVVKADMVTRLGVEIERARMRVLIGTQQQPGVGKPAQEPHQRRRPVQREDRRRLFGKRIVADAAALLMTGDIIPVQPVPHLPHIGKQRVDRGRGQEAAEMEEFVLIAIALSACLEVHRREGLRHTLFHGRSRSNHLGCSPIISAAVSRAALVMARPASMRAISSRRPSGSSRRTHVTVRFLTTLFSTRKCVSA